MSKTITGGLSYRKQYALQCILKDIRTRAFDNCFEMGDGDDVVRYIMKRATEPVIDGTNRAETQRKLVVKLKEKGFWNNWLAFFQEVA